MFQITYMTQVNVYEINPNLDYLKSDLARFNKNKYLHYFLHQPSSACSGAYFVF